MGTPPLDYTHFVDENLNSTGLHHSKPLNAKTHTLVSKYCLYDFPILNLSYTLACMGTCF